MVASTGVFAAPPPLSVGEFAPWFATPGPETPSYGFHSVGGRFILLAFLPDPGADRDMALRALQAHRGRLDDHHLAAFLVIRDPQTIARARNQPPGLRWLFDPRGKVSRLYGAVDDAGRAHAHWLLIDPFLRILARAQIASPAVLDQIPCLPRVDDHAGAPIRAPVLIAPRVFERDFCRRLIDAYEATGGQASGVMRDIGGRTVGVLDDFKRRRDVLIEDPALTQGVLARIDRRLVPEIEKAFQFRATRLERQLVACYDAAEGGYFRAHRDNQALATAHRRFAVTINLNSEDYEGGDLRFPEFGQQTYRAPTGGAVVFSCSLLHEATPVTRGRRYAFLPFAYDEAGSRVRLEREAFLEVGSGGRAQG